MLTNLQNIVDIQAITTHLINYLPKIISALILLVFFWLASKIVQKVLRRTLGKMKIEKQATNLLLRTVRVSIYVFACLTVADQLQINIKSLLAGVGVVGLAVSFGAKDTIANIISGVVIIIDKPFREDDWISIGAMHATVTEIRLRTTVLTTFDNETVVIPNQQMSQERIVNYTISPRIRVKVPVGIAYKEDISHAKKIILGTVEGDNRILPSPAPMVVVTGLADSSVNLQLRFWIENPTELYSFIWEYTEKCKKALDEAGVEIPFPHLQLFVEKSEGIDALAGN